MFVFVCLLVLFCVGRGLCDGLITHPKESYRVSIRLRNLRKRFYVPQWELKELRERESYVRQQSVFIALVFVNLP
jgi:hypothetical protein